MTETIFLRSFSIPFFVCVCITKKENNEVRRFWSWKTLKQVVSIILWSWLRRIKKKCVCTKHKSLTKNFSNPYDVCNPWPGVNKNVPSSFGIWFFTCWFHHIFNFPLKLSISQEIFFCRKRWKSKIEPSSLVQPDFRYFVSYWEIL